MNKETGSGLIPPSSIWFCNWLGAATWWMVVGGVSEARTNGVDRSRQGEPSLPMDVG
ncbi:hypothetical protein TNCV_985621, partial [Trichonephila clavipes]